MEQELQNQDTPLFNLSIDPLVRSHLAETARWGKFLAIVGFIGCGLLLIGGPIFAMSPKLVNASLSDESAPANISPAVIIVYVLVADLLYFLPCLFLFRFSQKMKLALATDNQADLTIGFQNLKVLFRFVGILTIIFLSLYVLAIVFIGLGLLISGK